MKIYVGYILTDYARPLYVSTDKAKVKKELNKMDDYRRRIKAYELKDDNVIELDCD